MQDLQQLRQQIDAIDQQLGQLFLQRMEVVRQVASYKLEQGLPVLQPQREQQVIQKARQRAPEEMADYMEEFFTAAMAVSRRMQQDLIDRHGQKQPLE